MKLGDVILAAIGIELLLIVPILAAVLVYKVWTEDCLCSDKQKHEVKNEETVFIPGNDVPGVGAHELLDETR